MNAEGGGRQTRDLLTGAGVPLDRWADDPDRSLAELLETFAAVCDAVAGAHRRGALCRRLEPAAVLVAPDGRPKVPGLGRPLADAAGGVVTLRPGGGRSPRRLAYTSPEQVRGRRPATERSDVYSLGAILYRLLAGRPPFDLRGLGPARAAAALSAAPRPLREVHPDLGGGLETLVETAMAGCPERRYRSAAELAADVRRYLAHRRLRGPRGSWLRGWAGRFRLYW